MIGRTPVTRRRSAGRERGAVIVEAAIAIPLLLLLLFGIIDFGWIFNDYLSVRNGTREGARQAAVSTEPIPAGGVVFTDWNCPTTPAPAVIKAANPDAYALICYVKDRLGLNQTNTRVSIWFTPQAKVPLYATGQPVVVCTQYPLTSISGFMTKYLFGTALTSKVEIRIEQDSSTFLVGYQETPLAGTSWDPSCITP